MFKIKSNIITVMVLSAIFMYTRGDDPDLKISPTNKAVEPGHDVTFVCTHYPEDTSADQMLEWYISGEEIPISNLLQNGTFINETLYTIVNETLFKSRYSVNGGSLTINNVQFNDAHIYVCKSPDGKLSKETMLKVYNMPSYFTEGMIVVGINIGLIAIFILCSIWSFVRNRRENRETRRKQKLGHKELAKRMISE